MTTRVWTREALDAAHPEVKAAGWMWRANAITGWDAVRFDEIGRLVGRVSANRTCVFATLNNLPSDVHLAVILASRGMDSLGVMAAKMETEAATHRTMAGMALDARKPTVAQCAELMADVYDSAAAMLRRGTVAPA
jgi:hypothetical protein